MNTFLKYFGRITSVVLLISLTFLRDYVFVHVNYRMGHLCWNSFKYDFPAALRFLDSFDCWGLYYLKYVLTGLSILFFFIAAGWAIQSFFGERKYWRWVIYAYAVILALSGIAFGTLYFIKGTDFAFVFTRRIMDIAESPVLAMILITAVYLHRKLQSHKTVD